MPFAPEPAWTMRINDAVYTVKSTAPHGYTIWCGAEELGSFDFFPEADDRPTAFVRLAQVPRGVAHAFVAAYRASVAQ